MAPPTPQTTARSGRDLIDHALFERIATRISNEHGFSWMYSARILDQALLFLVGCGISDRPLSPSRRVDIGWHALLLHTQEYAEICERVAGRYIHHRPLDGDSDGDVSTVVSPEETAKFLAEQGLEVDLWLWQAYTQGADRADCSNCCKGGYDHSDET